MSTRNNSQTNTQQRGGSSSVTQSSQTSGSRTHSHSHTEGGSVSVSGGKSWASGQVEGNTSFNRKLYGSNWEASDPVNKAYERLNDTLNNKPGAFSSSYQGKLDSLYNQIMGRSPFNYNFNADPLYRQARDNYVRDGQRAMRDTIGQASTLTGGYNNSYAQTVGQQQYQNAMASLNNIIPALRDQAYQEWKEEGQDMYNKYNLTNSAYDKEYGRYRDKVADWQGDRAFDTARYQSERDFDFNRYNTNRNFWNNEYWNEKNAERSNSQRTDSRHWSDTVTDSETTGYSNGTSATNAQNWANSMSNTIANSIKGGKSWKHKRSENPLKLTHAQYEDLSSIKKNKDLKRRILALVSSGYDSELLLRIAHERGIKFY